MIMKYLRRGFSILPTLDPKFISAKYPINTPVGVLKALKNYRPHFDLCYFSKQNLKWSFEEIDKYSNAFSYGLLESGFQKNDKMLFWLDSIHAAECIIGILGISKAGGISVFASSSEDIQKIIKDSSIKGILLTPFSNNLTSKSKLEKLIEYIPELSEGKLPENYRHLNRIIQTSFVTIKGMIKFNEHMVYSKPSMTLFSHRSSEGVDPFLEYSSKLLTNDDICKDADEYFKTHSLDKHNSIILICDDFGYVEAKIAIGAMMNKKYLTFAQTNEMEKVFKLIKSQGSTCVISREEFENAPIPNKSQPWAEEIKKNISQYLKI